MLTYILNPYPNCMNSIKRHLKIKFKFLKLTPTFVSVFIQNRLCRNNLSVPERKDLLKHT